MASTFSISGLVSGIDWDSMISQLVAIQRNPITLLENKQTTLTEKKSAWSEVNTMLLSLKTAASDLSSAEDFDVFTSSATVTGTSSDVEDLLDVAVGTNASEGTYSITVDQLATAQKLASGSFSSESEALGISGDLTINGQSITISTTDSLEDIQTKINALNSGDDPVGVTASILAVSDSEYRLTLTSKTTGADGFTFTDGTGSLGMTEIVAGQDAQITVDGFTITRSTNEISDVISGVTLDLVGADEDATITLDITRDTDGIKEKIQEFVDSYNELMSYVEEQNTVSEDGETTGTLFADSSLLSVKSTLRSIILSEVSGLDSTLDHLSLIGINIDETGQLSIDEDTLDGYLETNFSDVMSLFVAQGSSTNTDLTYIYSDEDTSIEGDYEVEITQVATQASVTGSGFSGTLGSDATLTLTGSGGAAEEISLTSGMDIDAIVDAINAGNTQGIVAENDGGQLKLSGDSYGSSGSFTVSVAGGSLGVADGTYTGVDVAGRIREAGSSEWMTMTGQGQVLIGDEDQDVEDLRLQYTGTSTGTFDFTFTQGVGEKLDQALYSMTDSVDGYVANKQTSIQDQIDNIDDKIDAMEIRLTKYQETLIAKYTAMETMLSTLESQQSWLEGQLSSLSSD
ncbi:MAG TPA: flagellar filament capping protein FliD [Deltaproteobacteria bacterium]|nr:flagellar filament capping protein FliD [Deltaproteobacteria bacterium]HPJ92661.1 flagellar filament capping protein FliD [Deltaproteobacteria bacterium]HPR55203.1 flagellar filament capping protein FliD [Deltaproteobacteria bacterium]